MAENRETNKPDDYSVRVDTQKIGESIEKMVKQISAKVIGQPRAIDHVIRLLSSQQVGLRDPHRPIGTMIFAGPTGVGKTMTAKEVARIFVGGSYTFYNPLTFVQCANLTERHQVASLIGSPPGYVDSDKIPLLHRFNVDKYSLIGNMEACIRFAKNKEERKAREEALKNTKQLLQLAQMGKKEYVQEMEGDKKETINVYQFLNTLFRKSQPLKSVVLFDEIEKAHPNVWNLLLGIMEEGELQMANNNEVTTFRNSLIILTTNTGSREIQKLSKGRLGFKVPSDRDKEMLEQAIYNEAKKALEKIFPPELVGRLGNEIVVFRALQKEDNSKILEQFLAEIQLRLSGRRRPLPSLSLSYTADFKNFLVEKGTSQEYGARILRDTVKEKVEDPIALAISSGELTEGDKILFDVENGESVLKRQPRDYRKLPAAPKTNIELKPPEPGGNGHDKEQDNILFAS